MNYTLYEEPKPQHIFVQDLNNSHFHLDSSNTKRDIYLSKRGFFIAIRPFQKLFLGHTHVVRSCLDYKHLVICSILGNQFSEVSL